MAWSGKSGCVSVDWGAVGLLRRLWAWVMVGPVRYVRVSFFRNARAVNSPIRVCDWVSVDDGGGEILVGLIMNLMDHGPDVSLYHISYLAEDSELARAIHHFVFVWLSWVYIVSGEQSMCGLSSLWMDSWLMGTSFLFRQKRLYVGAGSCVSHESGRAVVEVGGAGGGGAVAVLVGGGASGGM